MNHILFSVVKASSGLKFSGLLSTIAIVLVICAGIGMVLAYTRASLAKSTIELQAQQIEAQNQRLESLARDLDESKAHRVILEARVVNLEAYIKNLESLKTGSEAIIALANELKTRWTITQQEHKDILSALASKA